MVIQLKNLFNFLTNYTKSTIKAITIRKIKEFEENTRYAISYYYKLSGKTPKSYKGSIPGRSGLVRTGKLRDSVKVEYKVSTILFGSKKRYVANLKTVDYAKYLIAIGYDFTKYIIKPK